ncbi:MAG: peptidoglycan-binding protein [Acidobacteriota bacterium]|nr:peptidoglycan-binding protein [Acidobacteriota bacterium]
MRNYKDLKRFAESLGFVVTSTTGGTHNRNSKHFLGLAIDVRTRDKTDAQNDLFIRQCRAIGIIVHDERRKPPGQRVWTGAHLHLEIGSQTEAILRQWQANNNLTVDGIVGKKTLAILKSLV